MNMLLRLGLSVGIGVALYGMLRGLDPLIAEVLWPDQLAGLLDVQGGYVISLEVLISSCAIYPVAEELLFRKYLVKVLTRRLSTGAAIGIATVLFATLHLRFIGTPYFANMLALALCAHTLRQSSENSWYNITMHSAHNLAVLLPKPSARYVLAWIGVPDSAYMLIAHAGLFTICVLILISLCWIFWKYSLRKSQPIANLICDKSKPS